MPFDGQSILGMDLPPHQTETGRIAVVATSVVECATFHIGVLKECPFFSQPNRYMRKSVYRFSESELPAGAPINDVTIEFAL